MIRILHSTRRRTGTASCCHLLLKKTNLASIMKESEIIVRPQEGVRSFSTNGNKDSAVPDVGTTSSSSSSTEWRKYQLDKLEKKFATSHPTTTVVDSDEDLQPTWKSMESRVTNRRARTLAETGGRTGRSNIKKTDEEMWLQEGLYQEDENDDDDDNNAERPKQ